MKEKVFNVLSVIGFALLFLLQVTLIVLKVTEVIAWKWIFVFFPLIITAGVSTILLLIIVVCCCRITSIADKYQSELWQKYKH